MTASYLEMAQKTRSSDRVFTKKMRTRLRRVA